MSDNRFSEAFLDEVRAAVRITDVVAQHVEWDSGKSSPGRGDMWACCPFHGEATPSFHAEADKGSYHCFGCGRSGDHFAFLMELNGIEFPDAVRAVAALAGIDVPGPAGEVRPSRPPEQPRQARTPPQPSAGEIRPEIVKTYDYTDRDGNLLYQVCRLQRKMPDGSWAKNKDGKGTWKSFLQRRPDGAGRWIWSLSAGEFMRKPGGDWRVYDAKKFSEGMETRFFDAGADHTIYRHAAVEVAIAEAATILIVEGEKDADTATEFGFCGTTNSSGSKHWTSVHASSFGDADVVICLDNDAAGDRAEKLAGSMKGFARRIRVLNFADHVPDFPAKGDITDWRDKFGGTAEQLLQILQQLPDWRPAPPVSGMGAIGIHQLHDPALKHEFLIDGFLDRQGVAMMPGASGSGKTFLVLEMAMCVALGRPFWGMECKPGVVLYQAGEGKQGVSKRIDGWLSDRGVSADLAIPFQMLTKRVNFFVDDKDTDALIAEGRAWAAFYDQPIRMVVIDTFNKAITGANEISGQDMSRVLSRMERVSTELDCVVLSPIHKSKEGGMRGHTSLKGDVSNVIEVNELNIRDHNGRIIRTIVLDKNKDGEKGKPLRFVLRQVVLGDDERGKPITTCVIDRPDGDEEEYVRQGKLSLNQILVLKALRQAEEDHGEPAPNGIRAGAAIRMVVKFPMWKERLAKMWQYGTPESEPDKRKAEIDRVLAHAGKVLLAGDYIGRDNDLGIVWLTGKDDRPKREPKPIEKPKPSPLMTAADLEVPF